MRHIPLTAAAALALVTAGCATPAPEITRWTPQPAGASWEIAQRNTGSYGRDARVRITRGDGTWQGQPAVVLKSSAGPATLADPATGQWHALVGPDGRPLVSYDPPVGWQYPVRVGREWTVKHRMTNHASGATSEFSLSCKVEAYEKVTVPAGTYDAFRIHCLNSGGLDETYWTTPANGLFVKTRLVRPATDPRGPGTQESELVTPPTRGG